MSNLEDEVEARTFSDRFTADQMEEINADLHGRVFGLEDENRALGTQIIELTEDNVALRSRVQELEEQLARLTARNP